MTIIDTRGERCPMPLIIFKREIKEVKQGEKVCILVDNDISCSNLMSYLNDLGLKYQEKFEDNMYKILFINDINAEISQYKEFENTNSKNANIKENSENNGYVIVFNSDELGRGDSQLGKALIQAYINTLLSIENLPQTILFYNSGVRLLDKDNNISNSLRDIEAKGVELLACGVCVEFYGLKEKLVAAKISNMLNILDKITKADKVVYP